MDEWDEEEPAALGLVPMAGRGALPFALVHGESLLAAASWALTTAGAELYDLAVPWALVQESGRDLVVHDPLCPLTPAEFLTEALALSRRTGAVVVGVRAVTDTVKTVAGTEQDGTLRLGETVDRDDLLAVTSPVVLPAAVVAAMVDPSLDDLPALAGELAGRFPVRHLPAPPLGRRVGSEAEIAVLAALSAVAHASLSDDD